MKKIFLYILLTLMISNITVSQQYAKKDKRAYYDFGKKIHLETHFLPGNTEDSIKALVLFRMSYDLLSFSKSGINNISDDRFFSIPKLEIEFEDEEGIIRKREIWSDTIFVQEFEKTISKTDFIMGGVLTSLKNASYTSNIRLGDQNVDKIRKGKIKDSLEHDYFKKNIIGSPIYVIQNSEENQKTLTPYVLRNNIKFSSNNSQILFPVSYNDGFAKFYYQCKFIESTKKGQLVWESNYATSGLIIPNKNVTIEIDSESTLENLQLKLTPFHYDSISSEQKIGVLEINLPVQEIVPGTYELLVVNSSETDTIKKEFNVVWEEKPFILQKLHFAIESMHHILSDEEFEKMKDADNEDYSKEIINYWKNQDPTPETPYNEAMAEYFKRVDYAFFNFKTMTQSNGVRSDKGKIYILYGEPSSIEKNLRDSHSLETWLYDHLKKQFIFEEISSGIFKVKEIKEY